MQPLVVNYLRGDPEHGLYQLVLGLLHVDSGSHWVGDQNLRGHPGCLLVTEDMPGTVSIRGLFLSGHNTGVTSQSRDITDQAIL